MPCDIPHGLLIYIIILKMKMPKFSYIHRKNAMKSKVLTLVTTRACVLAVGLLTATALVKAATVEQVLDQSKQAIKDGQASQQKVQTLASETRDLITDFRQTSKITDDLKVYNRKLEIQIAKQNEQLSKLNNSMSDINNIQARVLPLAIDMINSLEQFVQLDMPFLRKERMERIALLRASIDRPELSVAEKFRQVLEAYKIETEYGRKIRTYQEAILLNGKKRDVNVLQVGRVALLYQTTNGQETGAWDKKLKKWVSLDSGKYRSAVQKGIRIAKKQASIDILSLPISAPEAFRK